ncbi:MAG: SUMF1/EgtB/PvdO family nonheme iron enzyme [Bacteroidales bacterium]|nr:SUMF1/EgtB/PvdO family nonheme iron enzyme [Bacteroidales bacterium]
MKKVLLLMALLLVGSVVQGQNNRWLRQADSCLKAGNCDCAQGFYDTYRDLGGGRDKQIEQRIADCERKNEILQRSADYEKYERLSVAQSAKLVARCGEGSDSIEVLTVPVGDLKFRMVYVKGGTFNMGAQNTNPSAANYDPDAFDDESPVHSVTLDGYFIGETEVTQALWREVMGSEPDYNGGWTTEYGRGDNYPAYRVSYEDVQEFIKRLSQRTGCTFRLPTEAEWEYAARGGNKSRGYKYSGSNTLRNVAWYGDDRDWRTHTVKGKQANELGLYDMSGNVHEWCQDWYGNYGSGSSRAPQGPSSGSRRVIRGGSWAHIARSCRVSYRGNNSNPSYRDSSLGFRLVLVP